MFLVPARARPHSFFFSFLQVGAVETRFRRKCMTVLLALCPLVVEVLLDSDDPASRPTSDTEGTRTWVWRRLKDSGRDGVSEAVRVFESSVSLGAVAVDNSAAVIVGSRRGKAPEIGSGGRAAAAAASSHRMALDDHHHDAEKMEWDQIATSADCYNFARETGIITAGELFLGQQTVDGSSSGGNSSGKESSERRGKGRASGKKRKAGSIGEGSAAAAGADDEDDVAQDATTRPQVLRSLAGVMERFGAFLEAFPFQTLVGQGEAVGDIGIARKGGDRNLSGHSSSDRHVYSLS